MEALSKWIQAGAIFQHPQISHLEAQSHKKMRYLFFCIYTHNLNTVYCPGFWILDFLADASFCSSNNFIACTVDSGSKCHLLNLLTFHLQCGWINMEFA